MRKCVYFIPKQLRKGLNGEGERSAEDCSEETTAKKQHWCVKYEQMWKAERRYKRCYLEAKRLKLLVEQKRHTIILNLVCTFTKQRREEGIAN